MMTPMNAPETKPGAAEDVTVVSLRATMGF